MGRTLSRWTRERRKADQAQGRETTRTGTRDSCGSSTTATTSSPTRAKRGGEYDADGNVVGTTPSRCSGRSRRGGHGPEAFGNAVFCAVRLPNGNTLVGTGNGHSVLEVTPGKEVAWQVLPGRPAGDQAGLGDDAPGAAERQRHCRELPRGKRQPAARRGDAGQEGRVDVEGLQNFGDATSNSGAGSEGPIVR